jgi:hypothetical protein
VPPGHAGHCPGWPPRASESPARKWENRPRSVPSRYSCEDSERPAAARFGRAVFSPGTEPDYEIQPLGEDVLTSPDEAAPTPHEIKVLKCRCAIKRCDIDSARRELSIGERAVR